jgi:nucleotide-binding universal stress UspA family protein
MDETQNRIVAAVAGDDADALLQFAAQEAVRSDSELHLVHVMRMPPELPDAFDAAYKTAENFGQLILDRAGRKARELVGGRVPVTEELVADSHGVVNDVVARSKGTRLVVLQHRHLTGVRRLTSGSTTHGVASRAHVPVVSVPESWRPQHDPHRSVTVAVQEPSRADDTLRTAFELADQRQDRLRILHAWWLANGYDAEVVDDALRSEWDKRFRLELAPHVEELQHRFPDVAVEVEVRHAPTDLALINAAQDSDLLVLGRRHPRLPVGSHLGSIARLALRSTEVPVVLVETARPQRRRDDTQGLEPIRVFY